MIATLLLVAFVVLMLLGVPIGAALGLAGVAAIALANGETQWWGLLAVPQNFYAGLGKYPLLAIPMFVLVGSIFDRSGVAPACCPWWPLPSPCSWAAFPARGQPRQQRWGE